MSALIEEINDKFTILPKLGFGNITISSNKVISMGQSFGGVTALRTAQIDGRVKACVAFDPWLFPFLSDVNEGKVKMERPFVTIHTENFFKEQRKFKYDSVEGMSNLHKHAVCQGKNEYYIIKNGFHLDQCDWIILSPVEI